MCKLFSIKLAMPTLPKKLASNEVGIDRAGLAKWLDKELVHNTYYGYMFENGYFLELGGRADESKLREIKEVLEYICKYNNAVELVRFNITPLSEF